MAALANITFPSLDVTKNCSLAGKALAASYVEDRQPYAKIIFLLYSIAPEKFGNFSPGYIVEWYRILGNEHNIFTVSTTIRKECHRDFCQALGWQGNSDIAGIGVVVSYGIEVFLATLFILTFAYFAVFKKRFPGNLHAKSLDETPFWAALQASVGIFWDSALLFGIGVSVAASIVSFLDNTSYTRMFTALSTQLVTSVLILIWPLYSPVCQDPKVRRIGLLIVCTFAVTFGIREYATKSQQKTRFEQFCFAEIGIDRTRARKAIQASTFYLLACLVGWIVRLIFFSKKHHIMKRNLTLQDRTTKGWGVLYNWVVWCLLVPFFFIWFSFALFIELRAEVVVLAGGSLEENEWGFGQILAIFTWLPTLLDFGSVWRDRKRGLERRLPHGILIAAERAEEVQLPLVEGSSGV